MCLMFHVAIWFSCMTFELLINIVVDTASCNNKPTTVVCGCSPCFTLFHVTSLTFYIVLTAAS